MIKKVFVLMSILPLSACGSTMQESDMIQSAYFCANESGYCCVLQSYEDIAAQGDDATRNRYNVVFAKAEQTADA